jgi:uncharacterized membrane protein HdeD (DUF308 family)
MLTQHTDTDRAQEERWLKHYYFTRAAFSIVWVALAFSLGRQSELAAAALLIVYPAWDALANYVDMTRSGGRSENRTQAINVAVSIITAVAVIAASRIGNDWVLGVFGAWAILAGMMQLGTAVRRWKSLGAQWAMMLSGGQSALVGVLFIVQACTNAPSAIVKVGGYAAVGALYFLVSALWLLIGQLRRKTATMH